MNLKCMHARHFLYLICSSLKFAEFARIAYIADACTMMHMMQTLYITVMRIIKLNLFPVPVRYR